LQLRPPTPPGADEAALAGRIDQFTRLYLAASEPHRARFAHLAPLTWAIAASRFDAERVEMLRGDLAETLFGRDDPSRAQLARQPAGYGEAADGVAEPEDGATDWDAAAPNHGALEIDDSDVFEVDAWRLADAEAEDGAPVSEPQPAAADHEFEGEAAQPCAGEASSEAVDQEPEPDVLDALAELERAFAGEVADADAAEAGDDPDRIAAGDGDGEASPEAEWRMADIAPDSAQDREPAPDSAPPGATAAPFDLGRFAVDPDALENAERSDAPSSDGSEAPHGEAASRAGGPEAEAPDFEQLTEAPAPRAGDLAAELARFREEMRQIAGSIPGSGDGEALARFREEVESVAGEMGQRVDGAAQRIEAAADRILEAAGPGAAERLNGAADRTEASAALIEQSVAEAVRALKAMIDAAGAPQPRAAAGD
ncbi:MAG: hypothetical protein ACOC05_11830, partial [Oceanicaulis sp.]